MPPGSLPAHLPTGPRNPPRVACVVVPLFPLAARLRSEPELREEAVVVVAGAGNAARVVAATKRARRAGIRPGFTLAQARARLPKLIARPRDPECENAAREALLDIAESFSPRVEDGGEGIAYLDTTGLHRHYPGNDPEGDLGRALIAALEKNAGLSARVGIAGSKLAASLAAQKAESPQVVPAGREAEYLAPLPLEATSAQASALTKIEQWGIHSLGELARLPEAEVISRLGQAGRDLYAIARGEDPRPLVPRTPPPVFREGLELEWPLVDLEPFLFVARAAIDRLVARMEGHGLGCRRLELRFELEGEGHHDRAIVLPAPTRDVKTLLTLLRLDLESKPPGAPVNAFELIAHPDRPRHVQLGLFGPAALAPDQLATTLARLFSILGPDRVGSPRMEDVHRPEPFALEPYLPPAPPLVAPAPRPGKPLLTVRALRPPIPVEVITESGREAPAGMVAEAAKKWDEVARPLSIQANVPEEGAKKTKIQGLVKIASGPWALDEDWWSEKPLERDYWDVELKGGGLYRLYRDRRTGDWFVDGIYD